MRIRLLALVLVSLLLAAGAAHSAPSRVEVAVRNPQAQNPNLGADDDDTRPGSQVRPTAGSTRGVTVDTIVYDENGHNDVRRVNVTVLRADNATVHRAAVEADKLTGSGTRATWRATVTMASNDTPGTYIVRAAALDRDSAVTLAWSEFEYEPLAALTLAQTHVSLAPSNSSGFQPGANSTAAPVVANVTNGGNVDVNVTLSGTALTNATLDASIPASSLRASRSSDMTSAITFSGTAQTLPGAPVMPNATVPLYIGVVLPQGLRAGDYAGEVTVSAVAAS